MRKVAVVVALLACSSVVAGPPAARADDMFDQTRTRTTPAGQDVIIGTHTRWTKRCQFDKMPTVTVLAPPHGGTVDTRVGTKVARGSVGSVSCDGRSFPALLVVYKPNPGFHGQDTVKYSTDYGTNQVVATVTVTVE